MNLSTRGLINIFTFSFFSETHVVQVTSQTDFVKINNYLTYVPNINTNQLAKFGFHKEKIFNCNKRQLYSAGIQYKDPKRGYVSPLGPMLIISIGNKLNKKLNSNLKALLRVYDGPFWQKDARVTTHKLTKSTTIIIVILIINNFKQLLEMINSMLKLIQRGFASLHIKIKNTT